MMYSFHISVMGDGANSVQDKVISARMVFEGRNGIYLKEGEDLFTCGCYSYVQTTSVIEIDVGSEAAYGKQKLLRPRMRIWGLRSHAFCEGSDETWKG